MKNKTLFAPAIPRDIHLEKSQRIERLVADCLVRTLIDNGLCVTVFDGEERTVQEEYDADTVIRALGTTDCDWLEVTDHHPEAKRHYLGNVMLIWGNGIHLISDYHTTLEPWLGPVMEWVEMLEDRIEDAS